MAVQLKRKPVMSTTLGVFPSLVRGVDLSLLSHWPDLRTRLWTKVSIRGEVYGIPYVIDRVFAQRADAISAGLTGSLALIAKFHPIRLRQVQRDIEQIWVLPLNHRAEYRAENGACVLEARFVSTFPFEEVAASIVFNATMARLFKLNPVVQSSDTHRITQICRRAQHYFGERVPDGSRVMERALTHLEIDSDSAEHFDRREIAYRNEVARLEALDIPSWLRRFLMRRVARRFGFAEETERASIERHNKR